MSNDALQTAFTPFQLGGLTLRNRTIKTATYEGMCPDSIPSDDLIEHHRRIAAGGIGMTTVAYCAVSPNGRTFKEQMYMRPEVMPQLKRLTDTVHAEGAAASIQLGHCGFFSKNTELPGRRSLGPSRQFNAYGLFKGIFFSKAMTHDDIRQVVDEFATAAERAKACGFDAVELHLGHGYLLSQFLSPWSNRRTDEYGGSLENRLRLPLEVVRAVRERVGADFPILCKVNLRDGFRGGLDIDESVQICQALEREGVDAIVMSGGFTSKTALYLLRGDRPLKQMIEVEESWAQKLALILFGPLVIRKYPFRELFFREDALRVREAVGLPLVLLGGAHSAEALATAMADGFELVAIGRAVIHDPDFVRKIESGEIERSGCTHCNQCIAEMDRGGVACVLPDAPGRRQAA
ncbi:MAG: NADH:flavin oxidoreductase [Candidatus Dadabacteria bacterium]|nr:MAG: NADH:flavin oxidoreductase [Candidatus Dadabacteria bacterium]